MPKDHYISQFRQRLFANADGKIARLVKSKDEGVTSDRIETNKSIRETAYGKNYYTFEDRVAGNAAACRTADEQLRKYENRIAERIRSIVMSKSLEGLSYGQWSEFCEYIVVERLRSPLSARMLSDTAVAMSQSNVNVIKGSSLEEISKINDAESCETVFGMIADNNILTIRNSLLFCNYLLFVPPDGSEFVMGDGLLAQESLGSSGAMRWVFPLSPDVAVVLQSPIADIDGREGANCSRRIATEKQLSRWNCLQYVFAENYIIARREESLRRVLNEVQELGIRKQIRPIVRRIL